MDGMLDAGQGFLKLMMSIQQTVERDRESEQLVRGEFGTPPKKRKKKSDFKDSGVRKTFIVAISKAPENYENFRIFLADFGILKLSWFLADIKAVRIAYGMQSSSSKFNCTWCHATAPFDKSFLKDKVKHYFLRTFKSLRDNAKGFEARVAKVGLKSALSEAMNFKNVTKMPLIEGDDLKEILESAPPGQLHVYLGVCNKIWHSLYKEPFIRFIAKQIMWGQAA